MNHTIRKFAVSINRLYLTGGKAVLDFMEVVKDNIVFIVMEEWSSQFITEPPCCLKVFLGALRQCIEVRHRSFVHLANDTLLAACRFYA